MVNSMSGIWPMVVRSAWWPSFKTVETCHNVTVKWWTTGGGRWIQPTYGVTIVSRHRPNALIIIIVWVKTSSLHIGISVMAPSTFLHIAPHSHRRRCKRKTVSFSYPSHSSPNAIFSCYHFHKCPTFISVRANNVSPIIVCAYIHFTPSISSYRVITFIALSV